LSLIDFFGIDSWLDISAGWGDRLIASIVRGVRYVGVDPYVELHEGYKEIISTLAPKNMQHRYTMICDGFENDYFIGHEEERFDLVGTCPPFFDLEWYSNSPNDSIRRYPTQAEWTGKFLIPSIRK